MLPNKLSDRLRLMHWRLPSIKSDPRFMFISNRG
jgi:hypothetical protein